MPRVSTKDNIEKPKRVPRRQVVKKNVSVRARKKLPVELEEKRVDENRPVRKAPTSIDVSKPKIKFSRKIIVFSTTFVAILALAIWIGTTDNGQINVASKIEERNKQIANGEFTADNSSGANGSQIVPVQNTAPTVPNGGLKGRGVGSANSSTNNQQASVASAESVSSSTESVDTTASSTEETTIEGNNETPNPDTSTSSDEIVN